MQVPRKHDEGEGKGHGKEGKPIGTVLVSKLPVGLSPLWDLLRKLEAHALANPIEGHGS